MRVTSWKRPKNPFNVFLLTKLTAPWLAICLKTLQHFPKAYSTPLLPCFLTIKDQDQPPDHVVKMFRTIICCSFWMGVTEIHNTCTFSYVLLLQIKNKNITIKQNNVKCIWIKLNLLPSINMWVIYLKQDTDHHLQKLQKFKSPRSYTNYIIFPISSTFAGVVFVTLDYDEVLRGKNKFIYCSTCNGFKGILKKLLFIQ